MRGSNQGNDPITRIGWALDISLLGFLKYSWLLVVQGSWWWIAGLDIVMIVLVGCFGNGRGRNGAIPTTTIRSRHRCRRRHWYIDVWRSNLWNREGRFWTRFKVCSFHCVNLWFGFSLWHRLENIVLVVVVAGTKFGTKRRKRTNPIWLKRNGYSSRKSLSINPPDSNLLCQPFVTMSLMNPSRLSKPCQNAYVIKCGRTLPTVWLKA